MAALAAVSLVSVAEIGSSIEPETSIEEEHLGALAHLGEGRVDGGDDVLLGKRQHALGIGDEVGDVGDAVVEHRRSGRGSPTSRTICLTLRGAGVADEVRRGVRLVLVDPVAGQHDGGVVGAVEPVGRVDRARAAPRAASPSMRVTPSRLVMPRL